MSKLETKLPMITLDTMSGDIEKCLEEYKIQFKTIETAPAILRFISSFYGELYLAYKNTIFVPHLHTSLAASKSQADRVLATSKVLPWVYVIKNRDATSFYKLIKLITNTTHRSYYFLYEFAMLKSHELNEISDLVSTGFFTTRKDIFGRVKNPNKVFNILKSLLATKIKPI